MENKRKEAVTLLSVLAKGSTDQSQELLSKYGKQQAKNYTDLENKLAQLYATFPDKVQIEKEFADIHPHTDFILKYTKPSPIETETVPLPSPFEKLSNCEGCNGKCGMSNVEGEKKETNPFNNMGSPQIVICVLSIVGVLGMVGLIGLLLHHNKKA